jgi:hypothetical protein
MAFGANGGNFILGQNNTASALSRLTGNVNGSAMQVVNNNANANDTALNLSVQPGEEPMRVNSDTKVANLNSDQVDGFHAGCLSGQRLIGGLCYDENPQTAATLVSASDECSDLGGQLPAALQLRSIRDEPNIDLGSTTPHWSADLQHLGTANPPNDLAAVAVFDSGGILLRDDQDLLPYRCVYQPLTPE